MEPMGVSLQQKFCGEGDLQAPAHDEIMLWLDLATEILFRKIVGWNGDGWDEKEVESLSSRALEMTKNPTWSSNLDYYPDYKKQLDAFKMPEPPKPEPADIHHDWQYPVNPSGKFIVGFVDMRCRGTRQKLHLGNLRPGGELEYLKLPEWETTLEVKEIFFEVRTSIPNLGSLVRGINTYREYIHAPFYVVSPDDRFIGHLRQQGIGFIKYPTLEIFEVRHG